MTVLNYELQKNALQFRDESGIGPNEPISFRSLFFKRGIVAVYKELSDKFSGMSIKVGDKRFMLINSSHPVGRQNFTICHELYHLFYQEKFQSHTCMAEEFNLKSGAEYAADNFASFLLLPEGGILELIPEIELSKKNRITLPTFLKIEQYFGCSRTALLYRLNNLGLINLEKYETYRSNVSKDARKYGFDPGLYLPGNKDVVFGDYGELAKTLFDREKISESHYADLMRDIGIDVDIDYADYDRS